MPIYGAIPRGGYKQQPKRTPRSLGFARYALGFDGVDDFVDCGNAASLRLHNTPATFEARIKTTQTSGYASIIVESHSWVIGRNYDFHINNGIFGFAHADGDNNVVYSSGIGVADGTFRRIIFVADFPNFHFCVDGNKVATGAMVFNLKEGVGTQPAAAARTLGGLSWTNYFNGLIDEVLIYNRALSVAEIRHNQLNYHNPVRGGLVLWLPMEEGSGGIVYDKSGFNNHGTLLPAGVGPTWERLRQWELRAAVE